MAPAPDRYHALDTLRAFAMFLGVGLHAGLSFLPNTPAFWPVQDERTVPLSDVLLYAVHDFRMQLFFLLAGFFCCLLQQRYGAAGMARHRVRRVAVPLALAVVFIAPTVQAAGMYAELGNLRAGVVRDGYSTFRGPAQELLTADPDASDAALLTRYVASGRFLPDVPLAHLWFLYYLLFCYAAVLLLAPLLKRIGTRFRTGFDAAFRWVVAGPGRVPVLALFTVPLLLPMRTWAVDTPPGWTPQWHILAYYFWFFAVGWQLFRHRDLVPTFGRGWGVNLTVANVVVLPVLTVLVIAGMQTGRDGADTKGLWVGMCAALAAYTWLMITGLWGGFLRWFARDAAWSRYLADTSYWCYLTSLTPIILLQYWVRDLPLPGLVKFALVTALTTAVLLASYEWCVRYTWVGAILNGRKERRTRPVSVP